MDMTSATYFDTHDYVKQLEKAGVPVAQAEVQSKVLSDVLTKVLTKAVASPSDLLGLDAKISAKFDGLHSKIDSIDLKLNGKVDTQGATLNGKIDVLSSQMNDQRWMTRMILGFCVLAALKTVWTFLT